MKKGRIYLEMEPKLFLMASVAMVETGESWDTLIPDLIEHWLKERRRIMRKRYAARRKRFSRLLSKVEMP